MWFPSWIILLQYCVTPGYSDPDAAGRPGLRPRGPQVSKPRPRGIFSSSSDEGSYGEGSYERKKLRKLSGPLENSDIVKTGQRLSELGRPTKPYDPLYYSTSYYETSEEVDDEPPTTKWIQTTESKSTRAPGDPVSTTTRPLPEDQQDEEEDEVTEDTWASLPDKEALKEENERVKKQLEDDLKKIGAEQSLFLQLFPFAEDLTKDTESFRIMCYHLGSTLFSAKKYLRDYYRVRYAYYNNKHFEIGYVIHEIIYKYTIVLELFHTVQYRYYNQSRFLNRASGTYMLYMYTNILEKSQEIIHLCNVLHEIEKKYRRLEEAQMADGDDGGYANYGYNMESNIQDMAWLEERARIRKVKQALERQRKRQRGKANTERTTRRTRRPRTYNSFPLHYGWSVEQWY